MTKTIGGTIPPSERRKLVVEDAVDRVLDGLIFSKLYADHRNIRKDCLFRPEEMGPMWCWVGIDSDARFFHPAEINSPEIAWPMSVGIVRAGGFDSNERLTCLYAESVPSHMMRGKFRVISKHNLALYFGLLAKNLEWRPAREFASWVGNKWINSQRIRFDKSILPALQRGEGGGASEPIEKTVAIESGETPLGEQAAMLQSAALTYRYEWGAQFSIDGSARVIIPATPAGVLELFRDRDKPADQDRRAPLRHWVRQHLRKTRQDGGFSSVREHLRGNVSFRWRGYDVVIRPAQFDQERNAA